MASGDAQFKPLKGRQGNTFEVAFRLKKTGGDFDGTGSTWYLKVTSHGGAVTWSRNSVDNPSNVVATQVVDVINGDYVRLYLMIPASTMDTFMEGEGTWYEIERRIDGKEKTIICGTFNIARGRNDNAA